MGAPDTGDHTVSYFCGNKMLCREIKYNAYIKHFTSVSLQQEESVQVGAVLTPLAACPGLQGKPSCLQ